MFKLIIVSLALFISAMFMQACGNQAENPQLGIAPKVPQATTSPAQFNIGTYTTRVTLKDVHPQLAADLPAGGSYVGNWNFNFDEQGRFSAIQGSQEMITGQYSLNSGSGAGSSSQTISFTGQDWYYYCPGTAQNEEGIYSRYFDGSALTLYPIQETCTFRLLLLSAHPLTFSEEVAKTNSPYSLGIYGSNSEMAYMGMGITNLNTQAQVARSQTTMIG